MFASRNNGRLVLTTLVLAASSATSLAVAPSSVAAPQAATHSAASHHRTTRAQLRVTTQAARAGRPVRFTLAGSTIAKGRHIKSLRISFGDHSSRKLHRLAIAPRHTYRKSGIYTARLHLRDSHGAKSVVRRTLVVSGRRNRVVLKSTTRRLSGSRVTALTPIGLDRQVLTLSPGSLTPVVGHTLLVGRSRLMRNGLIAHVKSVSHNKDGSIGVTVHDGTLASAYRKLSITTKSHVGKRLRVISANAVPGRSSVEKPMTARNVPFTCDTSADRSISVTADLSNTTISPTISLAAKIFSINLIAKPVFSLGVDFTGHAGCKLANGFELDVPVPDVPGLVVSVAPYFSLDANGEISASVSWKPSLFITIERSPSVNTSFLQYNSVVTASASGSASVTLKGGISLGVSVGHAIGLTLSAGPVITAAASVSTSQACISVNSAIELEAVVYANVLFADSQRTIFDGTYDSSQLVNRCTASGSGASGSGSGGGQSSGGGAGSTSTPPYNGPTVAETTGGVARTWTDYVHAGGTEGQDIGSHQTVGIVCKLIGFKVPDGNTWWYLVGSSPWNAAYYVSADPFYNNGQTSGDLHGTPFDDPNVPTCSNSAGSNPTPVTPPGVTPPPSPSGTFAETTGGVTHTFTDFSDAGGTQGPSIPSNDTVQITCKITGFQVADGNTWWYQVASDPWSNGFYASADAFYNDGATSGSLKGTPFVDDNVPTCGSPPPPPPPPTVSETTGGVTHTWTNYSDAGGTEGPSIATNQTVQITCRLTGFAVADGNTWWYRIGSSPWSNSFYASADAFYNNGATSGSLQGTPFVDPNVPPC